MAALAINLVVLYILLKLIVFHIYLSLHNISTYEHILRSGHKSKVGQIKPVHPEQLQSVNTEPGLEWKEQLAPSEPIAQQLDTERRHSESRSLQPVPRSTAEFQAETIEERRPELKGLNRSPTNTSSDIKNQDQTILKNT